MVGGLAAILVRWPDEPPKPIRSRRNCRNRRFARSPAEKKVAKNKAKAKAEQAKTQARIAAGTRDWVPWVFIPVGLLGVLWLLVFYVAGNQVPVFRDLQSWNYLIGIGLIASSFVIATFWK